MNATTLVCLNRAANAVLGLTLVSAVFITLFFAALHALNPELAAILLNGQVFEYLNSLLVSNTLPLPE